MGDRKGKAIKAYTKNQKVCRFQGAAPVIVEVTERMDLAFERIFERFKELWAQPGSGVPFVIEK